MPKPRPTPKTKTKTKTTAMAGDGETTKGTSSLREASCPPPSSRALSRVVAERHRRPTTAGSTPLSSCGRGREGVPLKTGGTGGVRAPSWGKEGRRVPFCGGTTRTSWRGVDARAAEDGGREGEYARGQGGRAPRPRGSARARPKRKGPRNGARARARGGRFGGGARARGALGQRGSTRVGMGGRRSSPLEGGREGVPLKDGRDGGGPRALLGEGGTARAPLQRDNWQRLAQGRRARGRGGRA